jgi:3-hydroxyisobutyrate dehydrogenase
MISATISTTISATMASSKQQNDQTIAFLGLGTMGAPMALNLAKNGFTVTGWNRTRDRPEFNGLTQAGIALAPTLQEAVSQADFIFTCLGDIPDVEAVLLGEEGVIAFAKPEALVVDFSTIGRDAAQSIGAALALKHLRFLDAPISGGDIGAQKGTLTIMVGGDSQDFKACYPLFAAMGKSIRHCGEVGNGQAVKMCNQVLCGLHMVGLCEAIAFAENQGIDPTLMIEICSTGAAGSWALANLGPKIMDGDLQPAFAIKHLLKDLRIVQEALADANLSLPGMLLANEKLQEVAAMDDGQGKELGTQGMIRAYR